MLHRDPKTGLILMLALILAAILSSCCVEQRGEEVVETTPEGLFIRQSAEGVRYVMDLDKPVSGGPSKDGIPLLDSPKFVSLKEAWTVRVTGPESGED